MGTTPTYGIYYDDPSDLALGRTQDYKQAATVEAALAGVSASVQVADARIEQVAGEASAGIAEQASRIDKVEEKTSRIDKVEETELLFAVVDSSSARTWIEATKAEGKPSAVSYEKFGFNPEAEGEDILVVSDGVKKIPIIDKSSSLSPRLLRYSSKHTGGLIPAAAGGVKSDGVARRNPRMGMAWEPVSGADETETLERLVKSVHEDGGGTIVLPPGNTIASVKLAPGVSLAGSGQNITKLILPNGANRSVVQVSPGIDGLKSYRSQVRDLTIEGNRFNQTVHLNGAGWERNSLENYGKMAHGIWIAGSTASSAQDNEGLDLYIHVSNVRVNDVYGTAVYARGAQGENRFYNVTAWRPGIGFISSPDSFWNSCTVGQPEFAGVYSMHGSVTYTNTKVFMAGTAVLNAPAKDGAAYRRRISHGWEFHGHGANVVVSACASQNNSGHGLWIDSHGTGANIQMQVDGNNIMAPWSIRAHDDLRPWLTPGENKAAQVYKADGVTAAENVQEALAPSDFVGAFIEGKQNIVKLSSMVASEQNPGSFYGWQGHGLAFGGTAEGNMVTLSHYTKADVRPALDPIKGGPSGKNYVLANGRVIDEMS